MTSSDVMTPPSPRIGSNSYGDVRSRTEALAAPLSCEDQTVQSMPDVSPTKWHRGHTTWFFETFVLEQHQVDYASWDPRWAYLFNSYYEAAGPRYPRAARGLISRPGVAEIGRYRSYVDAAMNELIGSGLTTALEDLVELGLHHEQQHQELLLMDIKHVLSVNPLRPAYRQDLASPDSPGDVGQRLEWWEHEGGAVEVGCDGPGFCFDNETPRHRCWLNPFKIAPRLVTNGDWLAFVDDGGYRRPELWLSEGWAVVQANGWEAPLYWRQEEGRWLQFQLGGEVSLAPAEPVSHVSLYEADAYARWADARLPTEAEWEAVAVELGAGALSGNFVESGVLRAVGTNDMLGDVWQWTSSAYGPYPGFRPWVGAVGEYNGKFMVNQYVLRGGSAFTPRAHIRPTYRNFFPASARWPLCGVRLASDT